MDNQDSSSPCITTTKQDRDHSEQDSDHKKRYDFSYGAHSFQKPPDKDLEPDLDGYLQPHKADIQTFLKEKLVNNPTKAGYLSSKLRTHTEVVIESQRLHFNILGDLLKGYKAAMLFDIADFENKGDPCITVGEIMFLARINLPLVYYCSTTSCNSTTRQHARELASNYTTDELVILMHGGGNIIGYEFADYGRFDILRRFSGYKIISFPQSIFLRDTSPKKNHIPKCVRQYCCNENLTLVLRDELSYSLAKKYFNGSTKLLMAPDMAFQIGTIDRIQLPVFDVLWVMREDDETPGYKSIPSHPPDIRFHVSDWWGWGTNTRGVPTSMERAFGIAANGFLFLSRGRVVVSDRLHGHILATIMNIPHTLIDNK